MFKYVKQLRTSVVIGNKLKLEYFNQIIHPNSNIVCIYINSNKKHVMSPKKKQKH